MRNSIIHASRFGPGRRTAITRPTIPGSANALRLLPNENRIETGWSRSSDGIALFFRQEMLANPEGPGVSQAGQIDAGMIGSGGIDDQRAELVRALERPLRDIGVLDARARDVDDRAPEDAPVDLDPPAVHFVRGVPVGDFGPRLRMPRQEAAEDHPSGAGCGEAGQRKPRRDPEHERGEERHAGGKRRDDPAHSLLMRNVPRIEAALDAIGDGAVGIDAFSHGPSWPLFWISARGWSWASPLCSSRACF